VNANAHKSGDVLLGLPPWGIGHHNRTLHIATTMRCAVACIEQWTDESAGASLLLLKRATRDHVRVQWQSARRLLEKALTTSRIRPQSP
jgi:hypothetical protein